MLYLIIGIIRINPTLNTFAIPIQDFQIPIQNFQIPIPIKDIQSQDFHIQDFQIQN